MCRSIGGRVCRVLAPSARARPVATSVPYELRGSGSWRMCKNFPTPHCIAVLVKSGELSRPLSVVGDSHDQTPLAACHLRVRSGVQYGARNGVWSWLEARRTCGAELWNSAIFGGFVPPTPPPYRRGSCEGVACGEGKGPPGGEARVVLVCTARQSGMYLPSFAPIVPAFLRAERALLMDCSADLSPFAPSCSMSCARVTPSV